MDYRAVEPGTIRDRPGNDTVFNHLAVGAQAARPNEPYAIDAFVLHTHPDLCDRLLQIGDSVPGASAAGLYGVACLLDGADVVRVVARGTSSLWLRLPTDARAAVLADDAADAPEFGPDWIRINAWQTIRPLAEGTARLRGLVALAFGASNA